jgi:hypothetical protein
MNPKVIWMKKEREIPAIEVITREQAQLVGKMRERGIAYYQHQTACLN